LYVGTGLGTDIDYVYAMIKAGIQWLQLDCDFNYLGYYFNKIIYSIKNRINEKK
jgi:hypothetical protein